MSEKIKQSRERTCFPSLKFSTFGGEGGGGGGGGLHKRLVLRPLLFCNIFFLLESQKRQNLNLGNAVKSKKCKTFYLKPVSIYNSRLELKLDLLWRRTLMRHTK